MMRSLPHGAVIGMIHVGATPGTPRAELTVRELIASAVADALALIDGGVHALMIENMHDRPFLKGHVGPEVIAVMTMVAQAIRAKTELPIGVQMLAAANKEALAVALAADLDFVRVEGFVFGHVADEGYIDGCAGDLLRYRKMIGADHIKVFADIKKKHSSHAITADLDIAEIARAAEFFLADGVIITGVRTGTTADLSEIAAVKSATSLPVLVGSGVELSNIRAYFNAADGVIVGTSIKTAGDWKQGVEVARVRELMAAAAVDA